MSQVISLMAGDGIPGLASWETAVGDVSYCCNCLLKAKSRTCVAVEELGVPLGLPDFSLVETASSTTGSWNKNASMVSRLRSRRSAPATIATLVAGNRNSG